MRYEITIFDRELNLESCIDCDYFLGVIHSYSIPKVVLHGSFDLNVIYDCHKLMISYLHNCGQVGFSFLKALDSGYKVFSEAKLNEVLSFLNLLEANNK